MERKKRKENIKAVVESNNFKLSYFHFQLMKLPALLVNSRLFTGLVSIFATDVQPVCLASSMLRALLMLL